MTDRILHNAGNNPDQPEPNKPLICEVFKPPAHQDIKNLVDNAKAYIERDIGSVQNNENANTLTCTMSHATDAFSLIPVDTTSGANAWGQIQTDITNFKNSGTPQEDLHYVERQEVITETAFGERILFTGSKIPGELQQKLDAGPEFILQTRNYDMFNRSLSSLYDGWQALGAELNDSNSNAAEKESLREWRHRIGEDVDYILGESHHVDRVINELGDVSNQYDFRKLKQYIQDKVIIKDSDVDKDTAVDKSSGNDRDTTRLHVHRWTLKNGGILQPISDAMVGLYNAKAYRDMVLLDLADIQSNLKSGWFGNAFANPGAARTKFLGAAEDKQFFGYQGVWEGLRLGKSLSCPDWEELRIEAKKLAEKLQIPIPRDLQDPA